MACSGPSGRSRFARSFRARGIVGSRSLSGPDRLYRVCVTMTVTAYGLSSSSCAIRIRCHMYSALANVVPVVSKPVHIYLTSTGKPSQKLKNMLGAMRSTI